MTLSPKAQFQRVQKRTLAHADLVSREDFQTALHYALLEYVNQQVPTKDAYLDACSANRIAGARQFVDVLLNLAEPKQTTKPGSKANLQYNT